MTSSRKGAEEMPKKKVTEAVEEVVQEPVVSEHVPPQAPRRQGSDDLLELNDLLPVRIAKTPSGAILPAQRAGSRS